MKRVELIGAPGVGKTTFSYKLIDYMRELKQPDIISHQESIPFHKTDNKYRIMNRLLNSRNKYLKRVWELTYTFYLNKLIYAELENVTKQTKWTRLFDYYYSSFDRPSLQLKRLKLFNQSIAVAKYIERQNKNSLILFDEGLLQRGVSLGIVNKNDDLIKEYYQYIPEPDLVIHLDTDSSLVRSRLEKRDGTEGELIEFLERSKAVTDICVDVMKERNVKIIKINTKEPFENQWQLVKEDLLGLLSTE